MVDEFGEILRKMFQTSRSTIPILALGDNEITKNPRIADNQAMPRTRHFLNISLDLYRYINCSVGHVIKWIEDVVLLI
jgi:hypothetical protein